ncbi:VTC domain-containing protein [Pseudarthrobacter sp. AL07]|uniref:VTC domain-containing protein n=1 Tax=unclassified Pseudarthrobacter TaxID=2647000 RepID=UPI00249C7EA1|nr:MULTISPECIES: VTC domain-containing protein [unclassified Pseudarthrobacter]MDI3194442.1 VTC domain-containing protein [Pseudarthrobacter sp. AL20]MDI3208509.1 VTC domain-containing protein [Pseudarthrobacter sp. AL07]
MYFDTARLDSYLLAAYGRRSRYKVRSRTYVDSAISFLEVKTEGAREATAKERIPYQLTDRSRLTVEGLDYVQETLAASVGAAPAGTLGPVLETRYHRTTLHLPDSGVRTALSVTALALAVGLAGCSAAGTSTGTPSPGPRPYPPAALPTRL